MLSQIKARLAGRRAEEDGFTLIELMVVVLIIAILIAIAIPTFLGARQKAQDRAAQSDLRNALTAIKTGYVDSENYASAAAQLSSIEPSLTYNTASGAASTGPSNIVINAADANNVGMAAKADDGTCWELWDSTTGTGTSYGHKTGSCTAPSAQTDAPDAKW